jgi:uncharacterized membrane protein
MMPRRRWSRGGSRMKRFEDRITIGVPRDQVFAYVSDFTRHGDWGGHGLKVTPDGDGPLAAGSTFSTEAKQFGTQREKSTITEITPGQKFAWESHGALGDVHHWFSLEGDGGSTSLTKGIEFVRPSLLAKLTGWRLSSASSKSLRSDLQNIKAKLEASPSS